MTKVGVDGAVVPDAAPSSSSAILNDAAAKKKESSKKMKEPLDCPLFLRKTYAMVDSCRSDVGGWMEEGDMFVVKDPEVFASEIIPQFFKHNNFASFVRQLNFYGFRKIKTDPIKLVNVTPEEEEQAKWWQFRHPNFQRGRLDLLNLMRRKDSHAQAHGPKPASKTKLATVTATVTPVPPAVVKPAVVTVVQGAKPEVVGELKCEVKTLQTRIDTMSSDIDKLTNMVEMMMREKKTEDNKHADVPTTNQNVVVEDPLDDEHVMRVVTGIKKRKVNSTTALLPDLSLASEDDFQMEDVLSSKVVEPNKVNAVREDSLNTILQVEKEFVDELFLDGLDLAEEDDVGGMLTWGSGSSSPTSLRSLSPERTRSSPDLDPQLQRRLCDAVATLPRELQETFVDRLVETITNPDLYRDHLEAILKSKQPTIPLPVAAATLQAILKQCGQHASTPKTSFAMGTVCA